MRDKSHEEQVERWARYVKENPMQWKIKLKPFLDSQILIARRFYKNLEKNGGQRGQKIIDKLKQKVL